MMINFDFIYRQDLYDSLKVNEDIQVKKLNYGDFSYLSVENFFKTPEKAIELLSKYPALNGGVYTPGARQNLTPMDLVPVLNAYKQIMATVGRQIDPTRFITSSNIVWKDVRVWGKSWMPHSDFDLVFNLWLCNYEGGTAIYKYKGFLNSKDINPKTEDSMPKFEVWEEGSKWYAREPSCTSHHSMSAKTKGELMKMTLVPWQNFEGDEDWELYYIIPSKYNTVAIYDGTNFHGTYANFNEEYRYSLISFYQPDR